MRAGDLPGPGGMAGVHVQCVERNIGQRWDVGLQSTVRVRGVASGSFHHRHSTLVLQGLRCVCGLAGEAKIDSWHKVLDPLYLIGCSVSLVIPLQLQATEAFWLKSSWFRGENTG